MKIKINQYKWHSINKRKGNKRELIHTRFKLINHRTNCLATHDLNTIAITNWNLVQIKKKAKPRGEQDKSTIVGQKTSPISHRNIQFSGTLTPSWVFLWVFLVLTEFRVQRGLNVCEISCPMSFYMFENNVVHFLYLLQFHDTQVKCYDTKGSFQHFSPFISTFLLAYQSISFSFLVKIIHL